MKRITGAFIIVVLLSAAACGGGGACGDIAQATAACASQGGQSIDTGQLEDSCNQLQCTNKAQGASCIKALPCTSQSQFVGDMTSCLVSAGCQ